MYDDYFVVIKIFDFDFDFDLAATKQLWEHCPSVCPSVCDTFFTIFLSSYYHEICRSYYHWQKVKGQGHRGQNKFYPNLGVSGL